jgi:hypothetical protein
MGRYVRCAYASPRISHRRRQQSQSRVSAPILGRAARCVNGNLATESRISVIFIDDGTESAVTHDHGR